MVVVDSGVWIDFFNGADTPQQSVLRQLLARGEAPLIVPDLVLYEVLRGFRHERDFLQAEKLMLSLTIESTGGQALAQRAAAHYRSLRSTGITIRNSIDVLLATFCIERGYVLLHRDRDFDAFEELRGLQALH
ncbi:PIN domain nuclease [Caenimonas koreensis]|uniref:Ribonuclease VapC n=1 Tax=Caenimonas koreensis DSM 17982 TaxID=1121255 RepID=A0A844ARU7_9BURK|nr:PIN domain nuclease [Caenimonas koreensis]MRD46985.1 PIN domain-containing protein [Caenimonas koreensis DSM 17982]